MRMAWGYKVADRISFGNMKLLILNLTDAQSGGSTIKIGCDTVHAIKAVNNTDSSDTFKEYVGNDYEQSTRGLAYVVPVTDNDDGHAWVWYR